MELEHKVLRKVRDHLPLQQGLRPIGDCHRIAQAHMFETIVHYNKD